MREIRRQNCRAPKSKRSVQQFCHKSKIEVSVKKQELEKSKPSERVARKVTGLSLERDKAAELPGTEIKKIRPAILP